MVSLALGVACLPPHPRAAWREELRTYGGWFLLAVVCGNIPDLDYIPGMLTGDWNAYHHTITHTLGWTAMVSAALSCILKAVRPTAPLRLHVMVWLVLLLHVPTDWLSADPSYPSGVMMWWPFSSEYLIAPRTLFLELRKADLRDALQWHNLWAFTVEFAWTLPLVLGVGWWRWKR